MSDARSSWWPPVITILPAALLFYINLEAVGLVGDQLLFGQRNDWIATGAAWVVIWVAHACYALRYLLAGRQLDRDYALFTIGSYAVALLLYSRAGCQNIPAAVQGSVFGEHRLWYVAACLAPTFVHAAMIPGLLPLRIPLPVRPKPVATVLFVITPGIIHPHLQDLLLIAFVVIAPVAVAQWVRSLAIRRPAWSPYVYIGVRLAAAVSYPLSGVLANDDIFLDIALQSWYHKGFYVLATVNALAMCIPEPRHRYPRMALFILRLTTSGFMLSMMIIYLPLLPQSAMALASFGFGYLMLAPVVLTVAKTRIIAADLRFLRLHFSRRRLIIVSVCGVLVCAALAVYIMQPGATDVLAALYNRYASPRNG